MYAFVHIERTAGRTVISILRRSFGTGHCDIRLPLVRRRVDRPKYQLDCRVLVDAEVLRRVRRVYRNLQGIAGHNVKPYGDLSVSSPEIRFFTFLRDPAARLRSHFLNALLADHGPRDFDRWIAATWVHNWQTKMIAGEPNAQKAIELLSTRVDFVGLTERFDESVVMLGQWLQVPGFRPEYRPINQLSDKRPRTRSCACNATRAIWIRTLLAPGFKKRFPRTRRSMISWPRPSFRGSSPLIMGNWSRIFEVFSSETGAQAG